MTAPPVVEDWRGRLDQARRRAEQMERPSPEQLRDILRRRAVALAETLHEPGADAGCELLSFVAGGAAYAVDAERVSEVFPLPEVTPVPRTPAALAGVVLHRGRILSIVDLNALLGAAPPAAGEGGLAIALSAGPAALAVRADALTGTVRLAAREPAASAARGDAVVERLAGATAVLDVDALAIDPRIVVDVAVDKGGSS